MKHTDSKEETDILKCSTEMPSKSASNKTRVLLVDDEPLVLFAVKNMLIRLNCEVTTATNGEAAVETLKVTNRYGNEEGIQLAFIDANMPIMNGYQTAATINELIQNSIISSVKMVCLSAQDPHTHAHLCKLSGMEEVCNFLCMSS